MISYIVYWKYITIYYIIKLYPVKVLNLWQSDTLLRFELNIVHIILIMIANYNMKGYNTKANSRIKFNYGQYI